MPSQTSAFFDFSQATNYVNASNMGADDASWATCLTGSTETFEARLLDAQGFTLPDNAVISGFTLSIKFKTDGNGPFDPTAVTPLVVYLVLDGQNVGDPTGALGTFGSYNGTSDTAQVTGSFTASVTAAQIKQAGFGVNFGFTNLNEENAATISINYVSLTVDYTVPASSGNLLLMGCG